MAQKWKNFAEFFGNTEPNTALTAATACIKQSGVKLIKYFQEICEQFSFETDFKHLACAINAYIIHYW